MLERCSALAAHPNWVAEPAAHPSAPDPNRLVISERRGLSVLQVSAFAPHAGRTATALADALELVAPPNNGFSGDAGKSLRTVGPGVWLLVGELGALGQPASLRAQLGDVATVVDLSHARCALQLRGVASSRTLAKFCGLDLEPSAFPSGSATNTRFGHLGMHLARLDDRPSFELLVFRGYAEFVFDALCTAASEYGFRLEP